MTGSYGTPGAGSDVIKEMKTSTSDRAKAEKLGKNYSSRRFDPLPTPRESAAGGLNRVYSRMEDATATVQRRRFRSTEELNNSIWNFLFNCSCGKHTHTHTQLVYGKKLAVALGNGRRQTVTVRLNAELSLELHRNSRPLHSEANDCNGWTVLRNEMRYRRFKGVGGGSRS